MGEKILFADPWPNPDRSYEEEVRGLVPSGHKLEYITTSDKDAFKRKLADATCLITGWGAGPIGAVLLDAAPNLKLIQMLGIGFENVDLPVTEKLGIVVANTAGVNAGAVAEHVVMFLLVHYRKFVRGHLALRNGQWINPTLTKEGVEELAGKVVGLLGMGNTAKEVVRKLSVFDVSILYHDIRRSPEMEKQYGVRYVTVEDLLGTSDAVSLHTPLTPETRGRIGARELSMMKPTAVLINTSRGPVVDTDALAEALAKHEIGGACLDCFDPEPITADHPILKLDNVMLSPHLAGSTKPVRGRALKVAFANVRKLADGQMPDHVVNAVQTPRRSEENAP